MWTWFALEKIRFINGVLDLELCDKIELWKEVGVRFGHIIVFFWIKELSAL